MKSRDYRLLARNVLNGKWIRAVLVTMLASYLGGSLVPGGFSFNFKSNNSDSFPFPPRYISVVLAIFLFLLAIAVVLFIIGSVIRLGYCRYLLKLYDGEEAAYRDLFSQFHRFGDGFVLRLKETIFIFLWSLLFVIPGIIAMYRYALAPFILYEHPEITAGMAIRRSKEMMDGRKWKLFLLDLSIMAPLFFSFFVLLFQLVLFTFIFPTTILSFLVIIFLLSLFIIGLPTVNCYLNVSHTAFYRRICPNTAPNEKVPE